MRWLFVIVLLIAAIHARARDEALGEFLYNVDQTTTVLGIDDCRCECNVSQLNFIDPYSGGGYGKYCGAGYTCGNGTEPGCDVVDECCRHHDNCIGRTGYCGSCECNIALVECVQNATGLGFSPCDKMQEARGIIIKDICYIVRDAPEWCAGCPEDKIPPICQD